MATFPVEVSEIPPKAAFPYAKELSRISRVCEFR